MPRPLPRHRRDPIALTASVAVAYVSHNAVSARELPALIHDVHSALTGRPQAKAEAAGPARASHAKTAARLKRGRR